MNETTPDHDKIIRILDDLESAVMVYQHKVDTGKADIKTDPDYLNRAHHEAYELTAALLRDSNQKAVLEGKHDMLSWCLSRTSMEELKERYAELEDKT